MKYRFFYGMKPDIRNLKPRDFPGKGMRATFSSRHGGERP